MTKTTMIFSAICLALAVHAHVKNLALIERNNTLEERTDTFTTICKSFADDHSKVLAQKQHCNKQLQIIKPHTPPSQLAQLKKLIAKRNIQYGIGGN